MNTIFKTISLELQRKCMVRTGDRSSTGKPHSSKGLAGAGAKTNIHPTMAAPLRLLVSEVEMNMGLGLGLGWALPLLKPTSQSSNAYVYIIPSLCT